jgi:hypothetical protein
MTIQVTLIEIVGLFLAMLVPALLWAWQTHDKLKRLVSMHNKLIDMHENPSEYGLVTEVDDVHTLLREQTDAIKELHVEHAGALRDLSRAVNGLTEYLRWAMEHPEKPAPPQSTFEAKATS